MKNIIIENIEVAIKFYDSKGANTTTYIFAVSCFHIYKLWKSIFYNEMGKKERNICLRKIKSSIIIKEVHATPFLGHNIIHE